MPADYQCANCHQLVCVDVGMAGVVFPEGGGPETHVRVRCPHCGTENTYRVPRQAPEEYEPAPPAAGPDPDQSGSNVTRPLAPSTRRR